MAYRAELAQNDRVLENYAKSVKAEGVENKQQLDFLEKKVVILIKVI